VTIASTRPSAPTRATGSSQSTSSAALRLDAANSGVPTAVAISASPRPCWRASTLNAFRRAWPRRLYVSSTRPAPHSGLASSAARSARGPNPPRCCATATVRSTNLRSRSNRISNARNRQSVTLLKGARVSSRQSRTTCHRRSAAMTSTTSASDAPVYACRIVANANCAGGTGGCPFPAATYIAANSCWKASSSNSCRQCRRNTKSRLRSRIRPTTTRSCADSSTGGRHTSGRIAHLRGLSPRGNLPSPLQLVNKPARSPLMSPRSSGQESPRQLAAAAVPR